MTLYQAANKAFHKCRLNHQESRSTASYLAKQYLLSQGVSLATVVDAMPKIDTLLDEWFQSRVNDPAFTPRATRSRPIHRPISSPGNPNPTLET